MRPLRSLSRLAVLLSIIAAGGCSGDDLVLPSDTPGTVQIVDGNGQEGRAGNTLRDPLVVRLVDEAGEGIPDRAVRWVPHAESGTVDPASDTTNADGFASAEWTLGPGAGLQRVEAQVPGTGSVTFTATNTDDDGEDPEAAMVESVEGDGQTAAAGAEVPIRPAVRVLDEDGEPVEGFEVTFVVTGGGGSVTGATQTTSAEGIARVGGWTLGTTPGTNTLEATAGSLTGSPVTFTAEAVETGSDVDRLVFLLPPGDVSEGETFRIEVALVDAVGNVVPLSGIFIYVALIQEGRDTPSNGFLRGERFENTQDGVAAFDLAVVREGRYRLRALTDDLPEFGPGGPEPYLFSEIFEVE
jgi:hypothetical protein